MQEEYQQPVEVLRARHHALSTSYGTLLRLICDVNDYTQVIPDTEARLALLSLKKAGEYLFHSVERLRTEVNNTKRK